MKTNPDELISYLESINEVELNNYRKRIFEFLISSKARKFRFSYYKSNYNTIIN